MSAGNLHSVVVRITEVIYTSLPTWRTRRDIETFPGNFMIQAQFYFLLNSNNGIWISEFIGTFVFTSMRVWAMMKLTSLIAL